MSTRTNTEPGIGADWLLWLLRTHDALYPTGGHAHSCGLEALVQEGLVADAAGLGEFLRRLVAPSLLKCDVPVFAAAWRAAGDAEPWPELRRLAFLSDALRAPAELRRASALQGKQRLLNAAALRPDGLCARLLPAFARENVPAALPVAAALDARDAGAPLEAAAAGLVYAGLSGAASAGGKLLRLGQNALQRELAAALEAARPGLPAALSTPVEDAGFAVPWWDLFCARHETAGARMFQS
jgi:urease accessory protein